MAQMKRRSFRVIAGKPGATRRHNRQRSANHDLSGNPKGLGRGTRGVQQTVRIRRG